MYTNDQICAIAATILQALGFIRQGETIAKDTDVFVLSDSEIADLPCNNVEAESSAQCEDADASETQPGFVIHSYNRWGIEYILSKDFGNGVYKPYANVTYTCPSCDMCSQVFNISVYIYDGNHMYNVQIKLNGYIDDDERTVESIYVSNDNYVSMHHTLIVDERYNQIVPSPKTKIISPVLWPKPDSAE